MFVIRTAMEWVSLRRSSVWGKKFVFWSLLLCIAGAKGETHHAQPHNSLIASAPHLYYTCPEGATVNMTCVQKGTLVSPDDVVRSTWLFTAHSDQRCPKGMGPRNFSHSHHNSPLPPGVKMDRREHNHWLILENVKPSDQGRYCCVIAEILAHKHTLAQNAYNHVILQVIPPRKGFQNCTVWDPTPTASSVPVALAITACIVALLSLPLILVLVYKQRENSSSGRRGQELVRMDSETLGHENPVFRGGSPETKTRTVSQIMTRQSSETGRHLLSEPGTPLSPPAHGDVFFPAEVAIPESPEFL
ncbi:V-type immunoglobulin domain-containing suppressor of T-cell activation [Oreochromis aureus]|uniref:Ig-like domain-containing protein n=1 Tax=Oreochromis aureus TaxID=47969 RepID=A0AAZ1Y603_OREAU|nr:V-type immunoglobulin domain-containing suppressor of T-cell activation [Oreochromis aureus]